MNDLLHAGILVLLLFPFPLQAEKPVPLKLMGKITHPPVKEASGLVRSRKHQDLFWTVSDSGSVAHLFAVTSKGKLIREYQLSKTRNFDWESIAADDSGHLYIGDVGNNLGLPLRWIHVVAEPDPKVKTVGNIPSLKIIRTHYYRFPKEKFDVEAMFHWGRNLYLVSKSSKGATALYKLDPGKITLQTPEKICDLPQLERISGAALSSKSDVLALSSGSKIWFFQMPKKASMKQTPLNLPPFFKEVSFKASLIESCAFEGTNLLLLSEDRSLYSMDEALTPPQQ